MNLAREHSLKLSSLRMVWPYHDLEDAALFLEPTIGIHITGVGKSGLVARKMADTMSCLGIPAHFLDPVDALHGGMGRVERHDAIIAISLSGNTDELHRFIAKTGAGFNVGLYGRRDCPLAKATRFVVPTHVQDDDHTHMVPSASFIAQVTVADALAMMVRKGREKRGSIAALHETHPGGALGMLPTWKQNEHGGSGESS